jgi:hypothetical protein
VTGSLASANLPAGPSSGAIHISAATVPVLVRCALAASGSPLVTLQVLPGTLIPRLALLHVRLLRCGRQRNRCGQQGN